MLFSSFNTEEITYGGESNSEDFTNLTKTLDAGNAIFTGYEAANEGGTSYFHAIVVTGYAYNNNGELFYSYFNPDGGNTQIVSQSTYNSWNKIYQVSISGLGSFYPD